MTLKPSTTSGRRGGSVFGDGWTTSTGGIESASAAHEGKGWIVIGKADSATGHAS